MIFKSSTTEVSLDNPHGVEVKRLYDVPSAQVMHITWEPGQSLKPHKTPVDVFFYILEGSPTIHIGDESQTFGPDNLIESPANIVHFISNDSNSKARTLVTKAPKPISSTKIL